MWKVSVTHCKFTGDETSLLFAFALTGGAELLPVGAHGWPVGNEYFHIGIEDECKLLVAQAAFWYLDVLWVSGDTFQERKHCLGARVACGIHTIENSLVESGSASGRLLRP